MSSYRNHAIHHFDMAAKLHYAAMELHGQAVDDKAAEDIRAIASYSATMLDQQADLRIARGIKEWQQHLQWHSQRPNE